MTTCPSCGYTRRSQDLAADYECPRCGIVYAKYKTKEEREAEEIRKNLERIRIEREQAEAAELARREAAERAVAEAAEAREARAAEGRREAEKRRRRRVEVVVTDVSIPFESMVWLLFKSTLAAIPALALLAVCGFLVVAVFGVLFR